MQSTGGAQKEDIVPDFQDPRNSSARERQWFSILKFSRKNEAIFITQRRNPSRHIVQQRRCPRRSPFYLSDTPGEIVTSNQRPRIDRVRHQSRDILENLVQGSERKAVLKWVKFSSRFSLVSTIFFKLLSRERTAPKLLSSLPTRYRFLYPFSSRISIVRH